MTQNFQIFRSSAGSGKTYTLSLSYIALAIKGGRYGYEDYYRKILAITFTNKAASEMKERVLEYLDCLAKKQDKDGVLDWLKKETNFEQEVIFSRAKSIHNHILHHYADLGISTIDKFTYKIVRTFAADLGLSHNFNLEMDNYKVIQPVVALLLSKISATGGDLSDALVHFAMQKAEDGNSINIEKDLENFSKQLFKEEVSKYVDVKQLTVKECMQVKKDLQNQKKSCKQRIDGLAEEVTTYFIVNDLTKEHFLRGTYFKHFTLNLGYQQYKKWKPSDSLRKNIANDEWYAKGKSSEIKNLVDALKPQLLQFYDDLMVLLVEYNSIQAVLKNIYSIAVLNELMTEVKAFKKENNIEQISEFNKKIHSVVIKQPSSFIYERLGERYNHYLIDEFQDTSLLQWQNILPLITDSLDYGKSMLVGDGKQSIYRWRGGEVEQFFQLPKIYKGDELLFKKDWESKLDSHYTPNNLASNFRSRKNIINFNNQFFENIKSLLSDDIIGIYDKQEQTTAYAKEGGYVHIELCGDKENDFKEVILERMTEEIKKITEENNYSYNDIAILCDSRKRVALVAEYLSAAQIPVISNEGLLLSKSKKVIALVAMLKYLQNPMNTIAKSVIVDYLFKVQLIDENLHQLYLEIKTNEGFIRLLERGGIYINPKKLLQESLYEMVEQLIRAFNFKEDIYLGFYLDLVLAYSEKNGSSLSEFLLWWEDKKETEAIVIPEGANAVQLMTIHKSKGLAFNVVMIPFNWEGGKKGNEIWVDTSSYFTKKLPSALINANSDLEFSYFSEKYKKEKELSLLDNLNKLYVAMTRPKERLYVYAKHFPDKITNAFVEKGYLNSFLYKYDTDFPIIVGDAELMHQKKDKQLNVFTTKPKNKLDWRDVISLKHSAEQIWDLETTTAKRDWGILLHAALEQIHYTHQKQKVLDGMYKAGKCEKEDYERLIVTIDNLLANEKMGVYFSDDWEVKTEKEILMTNGKTYIPDRLLFSKNTDAVVVVDYKTGIEKPQHEIQITDYASALQEMGYKHIKRVLIYINDTLKIKEL